MKLLLDTHAFLFAIADPHSLSTRVRKLLLDPEIKRWVSTVSVWEIAIKVQLGKLRMPSGRAFYLHQMIDLRAQTLPIELRHSLAVFDLPPHHRDPFDRMLIAQAREDGLILVSRDQALAAYDVETLW